MSTDEKGDVDAKTKSEIDSLKQQRATVKRNISAMKGKIDKEGEQTDITILECRLQILESHFKQLNFVQSQIEKLNPYDISRSEGEEIFIAAKARLISLIKEKRAAAGNDFNLNQTLMGVGSAPHTRLPTLKLPRFDGKYADYKKFMSTFIHLVDNDLTLSKIDKFNYLLNCLSGPALAVVEPYEVSDSNYPKALQRLKERYDNNVLIFLEHISALFNIPAMSKGDAASLRKIIDTVSSIRGALLSLGSEIDILNSILIHLVLSKLDDETKTNYNEKNDFECLPSWDSCYKLLSRRCQFLETTKPSATISNKKEKPNKSKQQSHTLVNTMSLCDFCKATEHLLSRCSSFQSTPVSQRFEFVKKNGLCINCLRKGHTASNCQSQSTCRVCFSKHHSYLHRYPTSSTTSVDRQENVEEVSATTLQNKGSNIPTTLIARTVNRALIPSAIVFVKSKFGVWQPMRALIDSCSELNLISEEAAKQLQLQFHKCSQLISGIADIKTNLKFQVHATVKSRISNFEFSSTFLVTKSISSFQPGETINVSSLQLPESIQLADPYFYKPQKVHLLLGTALFFELLSSGKLSLGEGLPHLVNTKLGWIVGGQVQWNSETRPLTCNLATNNSSSNLDTLLQQFWTVEEAITERKPISEEEANCEEFYHKTTTIRDDGRIQVQLPFKMSPEALGDSYQLAVKRFYSLEGRINRNQDLKRMYVDFMDEYISLGHMSPVNIDKISEPFYVIPHHCVLRPESVSTKLRVVFDASAPTSLKTSLNDLLMVGPTIQQDLIVTLLAFRLHRFGLTADIVKMYRQFLIADSDQKYQLIVWRKCSNSPLQIYKLNTVTYGTAAAPFLAIRSLFYVADLNQHTFPRGSRIIKEDFYVDDLLTGASDVEELLEIKNEITAILATAGLRLTKWNANTKHVLEGSNDEILIKTCPEYFTKALGMVWKPAIDSLCFQISSPPTERCTKRSVLSVIARIFDVLGILSPIIIRCKILMQDLWIQNLSWDEELPNDINEIWLQMKKDFDSINDIRIPRYVFTTRSILSEIHGFSDASQRAYGCCIYVRTPFEKTFKTALLIAKSKVAPVKVQSIPRLELCAAVLLSRLWQKIKIKMAPFVRDVYFWTDSKIVLQWLKLHSSTLNCFVGNRIAELQENCNGIVWRHVPSKSNPADIVSRGCKAADLSSTIWFEGPEFLKRVQTEWPENDFNENIKTSTKLELKSKIVLNCQRSDAISFFSNIISRNSSYLKILRIVAYLCRPFNRMTANRSLTAQKVTKLTSAELENAFWRIVANIQMEAYDDIFKRLAARKPVNSTIQCLAPFIHEFRTDTTTIQVIRVGGRLANAPIPFDAKFPALLPRDHRFVRLYMEFLHIRTLHSSPKVLISTLRQRIWVVNARSIARRVVRSCVHCFRYKPKMMEQIMGNLPVDRLKAQRPFLKSGVDFCGPFYTSFRIRGRQPYKTYLAIFVCFASKATQIEVVSDLSTNAFLLCLKRFASRRGTPQRLFCDNATNFVGACNKMREFREHFFNQKSVDQIKDYSHSMGFDFSFIPPRSPHFGGLWEAAVKAAKLLLVKNVAHSHLTFEELQTVATEVEGILNSRPLSAATDDPNDGEALTPGHLLIGTPITSFPDPPIDDCKVSNLTRYKMVTFLKTRFWELWSRDYIHGLQQRAKWHTAHPNIRIGQLVIVHEDNQPPQNWILARVVSTTCGSDGKIRVVELKTKNTIISRPIHKIAPLPIAEDD